MKKQDPTENDNTAKCTVCIPSEVCSHVQCPPDTVSFSSIKFPINKYTCYTRKYIKDMAQISCPILIICFPMRIRAYPGQCTCVDVTILDDPE